MIRFASGIADRLTRFALALLALAALASCSGAVSGPPVVVTPGPLSITPAAATLYSDLPTAFIITGGNGTYIITSSNQAVIPIVGVFTGNQLVVVPGPVSADTPVTLSVSDTASATPVTAALVVKPRTVSNTVTVTPSSSQSAACGSAICSGGDAEVKVQLALNGVALTNRSVRFDVVSGDFGIITSAPGLPEQLALSTTVTTDSTGTARIRIRARSDAGSQTALLQITDLSTGFVQRTSFSIAPSSNAPLNAQPSSISFTGRDRNTCANNVSADVIVFGGRPPYQISNPGVFLITPSVVTFSGGRFSVTATGQCTSGTSIAVVDANGATVAINASNVLASSNQTTPALVVSPTSVTLNDCAATASVFVAGGLGPPYYAASGHDLIVATISGNNATISRKPQSAAPVRTVPSSVTVSFSDGQAAVPVTVTVTGTAQTGPCP